MKRRFALHLWRPGCSLAVLVLAASSLLHGATLNVGVWNNSSNTWGSVAFNSITAANGLTAGSNLHPNYDIATGLTGLTTFVISEAGATMSGPDANALKTWIQNGGVLLMFVDGGQSTGNLAYANSILTGLGSSISVDTSGLNYGTNGTAGTLANGLTSSTPGYFGVTNNGGIGGQGLGYFSGVRVSNGSTIGTGDLANLIRTDKIGTGTIFVFGDRFDSNYQFGTGCLLGSSACDYNRQLFANILLGSPSDPIFTGAPEPGSWALMASGLAGLLCLRRKRHSRRG
jgi:hypothetical protein